MSERFDVAVLGTGPAGLSAAVTLKIRNKKILLLGSRTSSAKVEKAYEVQNYLGLPAITGKDLAGHFLEHIRRMGIAITDDPITGVYAMGDYFSLMSRSNRTYEAGAVIIATGVSFGKPYPGEEEFLGRGVSYCATCDAPLYKGKTAVIVASSPKEEAEANFMAEICSKVYYIPTYKQEPKVDASIEVVRDVPVAIEGDQKADRLVCRDRTIEADGVFILRVSVSPAQLVPGLEMDGTHIRVNRSMETNLPGCFACGDITGLPYQYIKSAGEGNVAALSAVKYLEK